MHAERRAFLIHAARVGACAALGAGWFCLSLLSDTERPPSLAPCQRCRQADACTKSSQRGEGQVCRDFQAEAQHARS